MSDERRQEITDLLLLECSPEAMFERSMVAQQDQMAAFLSARVGHRVEFTRPKLAVLEEARYRQYVRWIKAEIEAGERAAALARAHPRRSLFARLVRR